MPKKCYTDKSLTGIQLAKFVRYNNMYLKMLYLCGVKIQFERL